MYWRDQIHIRASQVCFHVIGALLRQLTIAIHRQLGILLREVEDFRQNYNNCWPCIIAGGEHYEFKNCFSMCMLHSLRLTLSLCLDFNFTPDDAAYSLLVGDSLLPAQLTNLDFSRVVHVSIDPSVPRSADKTSSKEDDEGAAEAEVAEAEGEETDPDRVIVNARRAALSDGLLSDNELLQLFARTPRSISAYDEGLRSYGHFGSVDVKDVTFGGRAVVGEGRRGAFEPIWTSYTHVGSVHDFYPWCTVLTA
jgi:RNA exonuclease NGL2